MSAYRSKQALLIIDMQNGLFHAANPPFQADALVFNINQLIDYSRKYAIPIFVIRHMGAQTSAFGSDHPMTQIIAELHINSEKDQIIEKTRPNCFYQTPLEQQLRALKIEELIICGLKTEFCIDSTCRSAKDLDFKVTLISDAHSTTDSAVLTAPVIIQHHNLTLASAFVQVRTCSEFCI